MKPYIVKLTDTTFLAIIAAEFTSIPLIANRGYTSQELLGLANRYENKSIPLKDIRTARREHYDKIRKYGKGLDDNMVCGTVTDLKYHETSAFYILTGVMHINTDNESRLSELTDALVDLGSGLGIMPGMRTKFLGTRDNPREEIYIESIDLITDHYRGIGYNVNIMDYFHDTVLPRYLPNHSNDMGITDSPFLTNTPVVMDSCILNTNSFGITDIVLRLNGNVYTTSQVDGAYTEPKYSSNDIASNIDPIVVRCYIGHTTDNEIYYLVRETDKLVLLQIVNTRSSIDGSYNACVLINPVLNYLAATYKAPMHHSV